MRILHKYGRRLSERLLKPPARFLGRLGISATVFTVIGLLVSSGAGVAFAAGRLRWGAALVLAAGLFDMLDGAVARVNGRVSVFGAFIDSVIDRYSEAAYFTGLIYYYAGFHRGLAALAAVVLAGSFLVSYAKARAASLGYECDVGWMERPERMVLLSLGYFIGGSGAIAALLILALFTHITALQRIIASYRNLKGRGGEVKPPLV